MKYNVIKHLILLKIQNMMDINLKLLQWSINDLLKKNLHGNVKELHEPIIKKFEKKKSILTFYRQHFERRSSRHAIDK